MSSRFRDSPGPSNGPSSSWQRSNHHAHSRRNKAGNGNPIGNWINRRRRNRPADGPRVVGTEAQAIQNMASNAKHFNYPREGFVTPIEHSLLYAMILHPEQYPESVVRKEIDEEDFEQYLYVKDHESLSNRQDSTNNEERASYAQLSALLALSAEKNAATVSQESQLQQQSTPDTQPTRNSLTIQATSNITNSKSQSNNQLTTPQILCRKILKLITAYSESHNLDRQSEITDLLNPVEKRCQIRNEAAALKQLLPAYAGYTLSLMTGNPLPLLIGAASLAGGDPMVEENSNVNEMRGMGGRMGDVERCGLLDECEDD
ncbi:hypothetical protein ACHAXN_009896 [Cyclotella atomus]